jgi:hypothetical protein
MRRHRLMSREEALLRETVRRIVAEADDAAVNPPKIVPDDPAKFVEWLMSQGPAYATGVDEREGFSTFLSVLETATDAAGIGLNYLDDSPGWLGALAKGANIMLDHAGIVNSVLQFSVANDIVSEAERRRNTFDPKRADEIIRKYRRARTMSFCLLILSVAAAGASLADVAGVAGASNLEAAAKGIKNLDNLVKFAQYAGSALDAIVAAVDRTTADVDRFLRANPDVVAVIDQTLEAVEAHPAASKIFIGALLDTAGATSINVALPGAWRSSADAIVDYIPTFRREMVDMGYLK